MRMVMDVHTIFSQQLHFGLSGCCLMHATLALPLFALMCGSMQRLYLDVVPTNLVVSQRLSRLIKPRLSHKILQR